MGFCSGTDIFDPIVKHILNGNQSEDEKFITIKILVDALEDHDWDCQSDSMYFSDPIVQKVLKELHPSWNRWDK